MAAAGVDCLAAITICGGEARIEIFAVKDAVVRLVHGG